MKISLDWISQFTTLPKQATPEDIAEKLTMHSCEVEEIVNHGKGLEHIVVGEVVSCVKHPNADALQLCQVSDGKTQYQVVCGGSNVREGMLVAFGKVGAAVRWHGEGEPIVLKKAKIRGEESYGMICAADEIGLGEQFPKEDEKEILDLSGMNLSVGTELSKALHLQDIVLDVENKTLTHRPDMWGQYGVARELAAIYKAELTPYTFPDITQGKKIQISAKNKNTNLCPRYMLLAVEQICVKPSPAYVQSRLRSAGIRPINNIVDITNYVMLETGQPMHAFDLDTLPQKKDSIDMVVRLAKKDETVTTLDGKERVLDETMLVIADAKDVHAIAGVMGGEKTQISENTTRIVFEAANFDSTSVRRTATKLGLRTDSSTRFEKSLDPNLPEIAMKRAIALLKESCEDMVVVSNLVDEADFSLDQGPIELRMDYLIERIGMPIQESDVKDILTRLGCEVSGKGILQVRIPTWRATKDVSIEEDLIEEVARMYGYNAVEEVLPIASIAPPVLDPMRSLYRRIEQTLAYECGFSQTYNYSFDAPEWLETLGEKTTKHIELDNPIAKDRPLVRRDLIPNLLQNVEENLHRFDSVQMFEIGRVFHKDMAGENAGPNYDEPLPAQPSYLGCVVAQKGNDTPFFQVKNAVEKIGNTLAVSFELKKETPTESIAHPTRYASVYVANKKIGMIAEVHPKKQEEIGFLARVGFVQLDLSALLSCVELKDEYKPLPQYQSALRDLAFIVNQEVEHMYIVDTMTSATDLLEGAVLFDVYQGTHIPEGKKSMAYRLTYRSKTQTLTQKDVDDAHTKIIDSLVKKVGAEMRS